MVEVDVHWWAIIVGGVLSMVLGFIWYHPSVLGTIWMREAGIKKEDAQGATSAYVLMFIAALVTAYVMRHFVVYAGATDAGTGATTAFWAWLGFAATVGVAKTAFMRKSWSLFVVDYGYHLVQFLIIGALVASWLK